jgi:hypothetical protein
VPDKETGSCLEPELPGSGIQKEGDEGPGLPYSGEKSQLEPSRDLENITIQTVYWAFTLLIQYTGIFYNYEYG